MTPGGLLIVGTTLLIAAMDGGLTACLAASAVGGATYAVSRRAFNKIPEKILDEQRKAWEDNIARCERNGMADPELKARKREMTARLAEMSEKTALQRSGNKHLATVLGVAGFACPLIGIVSIAAVTAPRWVPKTEEFVEWATPQESDLFRRARAVSSD